MNLKGKDLCKIHLKLFYRFEKKSTIQDEKYIRTYQILCSTIKFEQFITLLLFIHPIIYFREGGIFGLLLFSVLMFFVSVSSVIVFLLKKYEKKNNLLLNAEISDKLKNEKEPKTNIFYIFFIPFMLFRVLIFVIGGTVIGSVFAMIPVFILVEIYPEIAIDGIFRIFVIIGSIIGFVLAIILAFR